MKSILRRVTSSNTYSRDENTKQNMQVPLDTEDLSASKRAGTGRPDCNIGNAISDARIHFPWVITLAQNRFDVNRVAPSQLVAQE